jgi:hypothetical protein
MLLINPLLRRISGHSRSCRTRRRDPFSPFGIQAAQVQVLENRRLLSALTVTTAADSGAGSLRAEIAAANSGDTIAFAPSLKGQTITLTGGTLVINTGLTIQGPGAGQLTISGGNHSQVFQVAGAQPVVLTGLTVSNGAGGGIANSGSDLTVSACTISNCHAHSGGGIANSGTLKLSECTISRDLASFTGGGIVNTGTLTATNCTLSGDIASGPVTLGGGGIYNTGTLTVNGSILTGDRAYQRGGGIFNAGSLTCNGCTLSGDSDYLEGGGIYAAGGTATLTNCTLCGDSALQGGGLYLSVAASATLANCTVSHNWTLPPGNTLGNFYPFGGGIYVGHSVLAPPQYGILNLTNTIVASNFDVSLSGAEGADIYGSVALADHDLIGNGWGSNVVNGVNGNLVGGNRHPVINAMLGPLQNNGGPTMTMALLAGSPAISHADNALAPATDQRGVTRRDVAGELTDIGAFEL